MDGLKSKQFLETARKRFAAAEEAERRIRDEYLKDLYFVAGEQWDDAVLEERRQQRRPALTFNSLPTFVQQVANEARQSKPSVKFSPVDSASDLDTAKIYEGIARHIQYRSKADIAFEEALVYSTAGSFGYVGLTTDYVRDNSFDQEIRFRQFPEPLSVYGVLIPSCRRERVPWAFVVEDISEDEFKERYPGSELASLSWDSARNLCDWVGEKTVRVAEYWYTETKRRKLLLLTDGTQLYRDEVDDVPKEAIEKERDVLQRTVKMCVTNGLEILDETEWAGDCIPIFAVLGRVLVIDGVPQVFSLVRFMRDPTKLVNIYKSAIAENIGKANRTQVIGYKGQFEGVERMWQESNVRNLAYLEVNPLTINSNLAPLPQIHQFEPAIQALSVAAAQEIDDLKRISGIYDASLGSEGNEKSGIAILRRQNQSSVTNLHFIDNLKRAQEEAGCALGYLIPRVYDTARQVRIMGEDEKERVVTVNAPAVDPETGEQTNYLLEADKYDVAVSTGPTYATKRQEAFDLLTQISQAYPQLVQVGGDIIFRNSDIPGADELADRLKKTLPPGLADDDKAQQIPPEVKAQLDQAGQIINQLMDEREKLSSGVELKRLELESRERIAAIQAQVDLAKTEATLTSKENIELLYSEIEQIKSNIAALAAPEPVAAEGMADA